MKTILIVVSMLCSIAMAHASNNPGVDPEIKPITAESSENAGLLRAMGAIKSSCPNAQGNLSYSVEVVSACFVDGFITKVHFWSTPNCPPNMICPQYVIEVGTVTLGCGNEVMSVECGTSEI
ncbi:MAG: hypothetical protein ACJA1C_001774 [Crocinitomicaceae bacterium]|jgi:hypothetical protein